MRVRRATGRREDELLHRAEALRRRIDSLLPTLAPGVPTDRFDRLRAELEAVREARDDARRLEKLGGGWRDPIARAAAGLLRYYLDPTEPVVAVAPFPTGEISFAALNGAPREAHVAVQQGADPRRLLLGYLAWARKGYHFWATADGLVCTGPEAAPPPAFRAAQIAGLPYRLTTLDDGRRADCPHLAAGERRPYLAIDWVDAGLKLRVCERCARDDRQLLASLSTGVAVPDPERSFVVRASLGVACRDGAACVHQKLPELPRALRKGYLFGRTSDAALLREYLGLVRERLERLREPLFVAAGRCHGSDRAGFLDALAPSADERRALEEILPDVTGPFAVDEASASRALEKLWPTFAERIVRAIEPDPDRAQRLVREARAHPGRVSDLLRRAGRATRERERLDALPQYDALVPEAQFADAVARAYQSRGAGEATKRLLQELPTEGKVRGLGFGLLLALGQAGAQSWQFTDTERQFGESLADAAGRLLRATPERYHAALEALLERAGVAAWGVRVDPAPADTEPL